MNQPPQTSQEQPQQRRLKNRPTYLAKLLIAKDNGLIKVITGMRRCGKSSLLELLAQRLVDDGVPSDHVISINLESFRYHAFDAERLYRHIDGLMQRSGRHYLLLDEVQLVDGWERAVNALRVDKDVDIYLTGSNAHLLSSQLATLLSGRHVEIRVFPLSFREFLNYAGIDDSPAGRTLAFERYTRYGGLPPVVDQGLNHSLVHTVLSGIYDTILVRDIAQYLQIRNPMVFNDVTRYLADTAGSPVSISNIEHRLKSAHRPTSNETIERYISGLLDAFLFCRAQRVNVKGGGYLQGLSKYYPADLGIRNMLLGYPAGDFGLLLENVVHNELISRGYDVQVGKMDNLEIDFVATRIRDDLTRERLFIQVSASILDPHTRSRELEPLQRLRRLGLDGDGKRIVLTLDTLGLGVMPDGVGIINALDWLLDQPAAES
ncbi:ATP-binding protein [Bifidobacterium sp. CP2]|uniref:ATP-binding protein n=1 Tax=Bifidobacterium sp. CP2 TaxID=2809025 RepID=UPI001BDD5589|nr:ATP-binding protein [Bifidobacterium sp. CP2]MBT1181954.1 ATP-binding protein [Bifidobacterium sp. CP2]